MSPRLDESDVEKASAADRAAAELKAWLNDQIEKDKPSTWITTPLFHYTDAAGLNGIFETEQVWFTSIFHQNDPSEMKYGFELAFSELQTFKDQPDDKVGNAIRTVCAGAEATLSQPLTVQFYVASFSGDDDELGQWRGYGDDGRGFSIGFAPKMFQDAHEFDDVALHVQRITYDETTARARVKPVVSTTIDVLRRALTGGEIVSEEEEEDLIRQIVGALATGIVLTALATKHKAYGAEKESRLIVSSPGARSHLVSTRPRGSRLIPFIKVDLPIRTPGNISKIVIGPAADQEAEHAVRSMLARYGLTSSVDITRSEIPYRSTR